MTSTSDEARTLIKLRFGSIPSEKSSLLLFIRRLPIDFLIHNGYVIDMDDHFIWSGSIFSVTIEDIQRKLERYVQNTND